MGRQSLDFLDRQDGKESDATQRIHRVQHSHGIILRLQKCGGKGKALIATRRRAILHVKIAAQVAASQYLFSKEKHGPWQDCAERFRYPKWQARPSFRFNRADRPRYGWRWYRQSVAGTPARAGAASGLQAEAQDDLLTQHRPTRPFLARAASGNHPGLEAGGARPRDRYCHRAGRKAPYCARYRAGDVNLGIEACVAGGTPILHAIREGLAGEHFTAVYGILNGTTNYILTEMERRGCDYREALSEAQQKGYA